MDTPNDVIAPFWDDLNPNDGGAIYYYADAANSRFIVEWEQVPHYAYSGSGTYTFQVILNADNTIVFQYYDMIGDLDSASIGIEDQAGTVGLEVVFNAAYVHNDLAILFSFVPPPDPWLTVSPATGTVPGLTTGAQVDVTFNATDLVDGVYTGQVTIGSNDPDNPSVIEPVTLHVNTSSAVGDELPRSFALGAAYPNPFNPSTKIAFAVPAGGGRVDLQIFDLSGRLVRTLVSGQQQGGNHTAVWSGLNDAGRPVSSGTYFYRLQAPSFDETKKMVLVK